MTKLDISYLIWGLRWLLIGFLAFELAPVFWHGCPWYTLTGTTRGALRTHPWVGVPLMGLFIFLPAHLLFGRPVWASAGFGLAVSLLAHLLDKSWP